jgi:hypothetical protein
MNPPRYVLIAGQGRSGTNWLLEIFDHSRQTHCRNEPNECDGSALAALPPGWVARPDLDVSLESAWDQAIARTAASFGIRDQAITVSKDHFSRMAQRLGLVRLARGKKPRRVLGPLLPSLRREEWPIPSWLINHRLHGRALPVHKLNMVPGWMVWVLRNRPEAQVVQIVRHPGGFLNSLMNRLWSRSDMGEVERANRELLVQIAACDPDWGDRFGDLAALSTVETELWYWRYAAEMIHRAGAGNPRYRLVKYEELTRDPVETSRSLYRSCGLDWDDAVERAIRRSSQESPAIASAWGGKLGAAEREAVERILDGSLMRDWWRQEDRGEKDPATGLLDGAHETGLSTRLGA